MLIMGCLYWGGGVGTLIVGVAEHHSFMAGREECAPHVSAFPVFSCVFIILAKKECIFRISAFFSA